MSLILTAGQSKDWWPGRLEVDKTKPFTATGPYLPLQTHLQWTYGAPPGLVPSLAHETWPLTQTGTPAWSITVIFQPVRWHRAMKDEKLCVNLMVHLGMKTWFWGSERQFPRINALTPLRPPELCPNNRASAVESPHWYKCILSLLKGIKKHMSALKCTQSTEKER